MVHFEGSNGSVTLYDDHLKIRHKGFANFLTAGAHGEKSIPLSNITAVQFKAAGFMAGYIQFSLKGGVDRPGGVMEATKDENAVLFSKNQQSEFEDLRLAVERAIRAFKSAPPAAQPSSLSDLDKIISMFERGLLDEAEFRAAKAKLLGL